MMTPHEVERRLSQDLPFFARYAPLKIKNKDGVLVPWNLNLAQQYTHAIAEKQLRELGMVRLLAPKARQVGESTYINGRGYHFVTRRRPGASAFVLSHEGKSTNKIFEMVKRYHENVDDALKPALGKDNPREMTFPGIGADYSAATARNDQAGRSQTAQFLHGSEVAYWEYGYAIADGALQIVPPRPGTEIWLESTGNGPKGIFYDKCMMALKNLGDYRIVFIPWFWMDEYEREPDEGFVFTTEEAKFVEQFFTDPFPFRDRPITARQAIRKMAWRRAKVVDLAEAGNIEAGAARFKQIYPSTVVETFQASGVGLFRPESIMAARKYKVGDPVGARVAGVDPAGDSDNADRTVISIRQGRVIEKRAKYSRMRPMELAGIIARLIVSEGLDKVFIDRGYGEGTIDRLIEMGYGSKVVGVAFNERPLNPDVYLNKRSEMIMEYAKWVNAGGVSIPDEDDGHEALACIPLDETTSNGLHFIKSKREIKKQLGGALLLDIVDADALTFAYPVRGPEAATRFRKVDGTKPASRPGGGPLKSLARIRGRNK